MNASKVEYSQRKLIMWYKINELFSKGLRQAQICRETGLDKKTVRRYHNMTYEEFVSSPSYHRNYIKLLDPYEDTVKGWLEAHCDLSSSQVHDWLRERYPDFPDVNAKTVLIM
ncbi:transposase [gut metagenome]|uniref:Transposase n=1 Tax=gut metagenome TaxID=749906 RepID=J9GKK5_9ZZZZ